MHFWSEPAQIGRWDGDTIRIASSSVERTRIFNVDAPELDGNANTRSTWRIAPKPG